MVIDIANFNFDGGSGGGGKPALLQEKTATIVQNGSQTITPDEGFDGMSSVQINAAITGASSAIDFSSIGYDSEFSAEVNAKLNDDVAYSKTLYDAWNTRYTSANGLYSGDTKLVYAPNIDTSNVTDMKGMFYGCTGLQTVPLYDTSKVNDMYLMFSGCTSLQSVPLFSTSSVTSMAYMFSDCSRLTSVPLFDTSKVTSMGYMFYNCSGLTSIPLFDTSEVTSMLSMFQGCNNLKTIPYFDTSKVTRMSYLFGNCKSLEVIPELDTSVCTDFKAMFWNLYSIKRIEGINFRAATDNSYSSYYFINNTSMDTHIRYILIKEIGTQSGCTKIPASVIDNWGVNTDEIPDARQSLIDSLITYSFDRATAGYPTCTIKLSTNTKALLTEDEIAQITAKGFTIE